MPDNLGNQNKDLWPKLMFVVLCFFGISTLILGILRISKTINPTPSAPVAVDETNFDLSDFNDLQKSMLELQNSDTDNDGLSDFDELYVYGTSAYLKDSDSDGYSDKEEIEGGYDPNCPKGQDCRGATTQAAQPAPSSGDNIADNTLPAEVGNQFSNLTPAEVRQLLLDSGQMTQEQLDQIDDATLMSVVGEILGE